MLDIVIPEKSLIERKFCSKRPQIQLSGSKRMLTAEIEIESNNSTTIIIDVAVADPVGMLCDANYIQYP